MTKFPHPLCRRLFCKKATVRLSPRSPESTLAASVPALCLFLDRHSFPWPRISFTIRTQIEAGAPTVGTDHAVGMNPKVGTRVADAVLETVSQHLARDSEPFQVLLQHLPLALQKSSLYSIGILTRVVLKVNWRLLSVGAIRFAPSEQ